MANDVGVVKYKVELDDKDVGQQADKTESTLKSKFGKAAKSVGKVATAALATGATAVAGLTTAIVNGTKETAAYGDEIDKMSQKVGMSAEAYQSWDYVLKISGTEMSSMTVGLKTLTNKFDDAKNGSKDAQEMFKKLGLSMSDIKDMSREDLFGAVITGFQGMADSTERAALANDLFGKSGQELAPLFNTSAEETKKLKDEIASMGGIMSDKAVKDAAAFNDSMTKLTTAFTGFKNGAMGEFLPAMTDITSGLADLIAGNEGATESIQKGFDEMTQGITNALPRVLDILGSLAESILTVAPEIIETLGNGLIEAIPSLIPKATEIIMKLGEMLIKMAPDLIKCGMDLIVQLALGLAQALPDLIPAAIDAVLTIVDTLIDNIDLLIDAAIEIIMALAEGLIEALPKLIEKAPEIVIKLVEAIIRNAPKLLAAALELIVMLVEGIVRSWAKLFEVGKQVVDKVKSGFSDKVKSAKDWGRDLIQNFIDGILAKFEALKNTVKRCAQAVKDFLGFSEPSEGPLSNFHTFAPDMMDLYAKGIDDNVGKVESSVDNVARSIAGTFTADVGYNLPDISGYAADLSAMITAQASTEIIVPLSVDGREIARASAWYMNEQLAWEAR